MSCHGNHAFSHSPNRLIFEEHFVSQSGVPGNNLAPMIIVLGCRVGQNRSWGSRNINKLYKRLKMQNGVSFFLF